MSRIHGYLVADHQTGRSSYYPNAAQALSAGRALAEVKVRDQGLVGTRECLFKDGMRFFGILETMARPMDCRSIISVRQMNWDELLPSEIFQA